MYWQKWYDLVEVQEIVNNITDPTIIELFTKEPPTEKTFAVLYEKYGEYSLFRKTVNQTMQWKCAQDDETFQETLWGIYNQFDQRIKEMDGYDEEMLK